MIENEQNALAKLKTLLAAHLDEFHTMGVSGCIEDIISEAEENLKATEYNRKHEAE